MVVFLSSPDLDGAVPDLRQYFALHDEAIRWLDALGMSQMTLPLLSLLRLTPEEIKAAQKQAIAECDALLILHENATQEFEFVEAGLRGKRFYFWEDEEERGELAHFIRACLETGQAPKEDQ